MKHIIDHLRNPDAKYRPVPFWSWNDKLDVETVRFQIREMKKAGMGGFFMHARGGLETEYLGEEWMAAIEAGLDEAEKQGLESWSYDEEGWPSGFAGGRVCELGDSFHGRWLEKELRQISPQDVSLFYDQGESSILGLYSLEKDSFNKLTKKEAEGILLECRECLVISHGSNPYYIDVLSRDVVRKFIDFTHEAYHARFADSFDGRFQGFFTDEPRLSGRNIDEDFPWSYTLPEAFQSEYGISLIDHLPSLFFPRGNYKEIRYKFWALVNHLFVHSFMKQLGDWCREHHCRLTGHLMMEETLNTQMPNTGGVMPFYEFMDIPGIDWLRRTKSSPVVPKQVSSVAAQTGKKQILSESFALCGWNAGFEDLKWVAQWQYVNGVNLLCQHLEGYTIRGLRKRDYPPSLFIQQPWWDQYEHFNTYFARLGVILSEGAHPVDLLVLHPMRSGWILFDGYQNQELKRLDQSFSDLLETLSGHHMDYHLGDETILKRHGSVTPGTLNVGQCAYKTVLIPEMITLASTTLDLLEAFLESGGTVYYLSSFPALEEGSLCSRKQIQDHKNLHALDLTTLSSEGTGLKQVLSLQDTVTGKEANELQATSRVFENETFWYLTNNSRNETFFIHAAVPDERELYLYDPVDDSYEPLPSSLMNGARTLDLEFEPARSMVLTSSDTVFGKAVKGNYRKQQDIGFEGLWDLELQDHNVLTLDRCRYSVDGGPWEKEIDVIHLFKNLLEQRISCPLVMEFSFDSRIDRDKLENLNLVIEQGEEFAIHMNGHPVTCDGKKWWKDSSFKSVDVHDFLVEGLNKVTLEREFYQADEVYRVLFGKNVYETEKNKMTYDVELENIYMTGDFAVKSDSPFAEGGNGSMVTEGPFYLDSLERSVLPEDLTPQGLLFFAGKVRLDKTFHLSREPDTGYRLSLGKPSVSMIKVLVNDQELTNLLWAPWEADLTKFLVEGENRISLILYGSNRNMLGPHHHIDGEPFNVGPGSFTGEWSWVEKKSEAVPATSEDKLKNYWDRRYAFVPFGLGKK